MSKITYGLNQSNTIYLDNGTIGYWGVANSVIYSWLPIGGGNEKAIDGSLVEDWYSSRLGITINIIVISDSVRPIITADFLLNDFLPSKNKKYKEAGWSNTIDVVLDMDEVVFENLKNIRYRSNITLKFLKKTPGLTV
ncbi:MAG: hypothetical protein WC473_06035 [Patescibacteria group bacterium]